MLNIRHPETFLFLYILHSLLDIIANDAPQHTKRVTQKLKCVVQLSCTMTTDPK